MANELHCPLYTTECLRARCGWWYEREEVCSIVQLVTILHGMHVELMEINGYLGRDK